MAKTDHLKQYEFTSEQSREQAAINGRKGGIKSGEARKEKKLFKEEILKRMGEKDWNDIVDKLIERAKKNDKSFEVLRDTIGQKPKENINVETKLPIFNIEVTDNKDLEKEFEKYDE